MLDHQDHHYIMERTCICSIKCQGLWAKSSASTIRMIQKPFINGFQNLGSCFELLWKATSNPRQNGREEQDDFDDDDHDDVEEKHLDKLLLLSIHGHDPDSFPHENKSLWRTSTMQVPRTTSARKRVESSKQQEGPFKSSDSDLAGKRLRFFSGEKVTF